MSAPKAAEKRRRWFRYLDLQPQFPTVRIVAVVLDRDWQAPIYLWIVLHNLSKGLGAMLPSGSTPKRIGRRDMSNPTYWLQHSWGVRPPITRAACLSNLTDDEGTNRPREHKTSLAVPNQEYRQDSCYDPKSWLIRYIKWNQHCNKRF